MKVLPLFKSHYSLGRSILTLEEPFDKSKKAVENSIFYLLTQNKIDSLVLVEDNISGLLQASQNAKNSKLKLVFGIRINFTADCLKQDEDSLRKRAKYIVFTKNPAGYKALVKIWSYASKEGFYYTPCLDFNTLKKLWTDDLILGVPFYDSFLHLNVLHGHQHVPDFDFTKPVFFTEDNDLPFDSVIKDKVLQYCQAHDLATCSAQSIFYKSSEDFAAYVTFRCIHNRGHQKSTLEKPELNHMGSDTFNFNKWLKENI
jgi:DNA polymerase III alpha subunit